MAARACGYTLKQPEKKKKATISIFQFHKTVNRGVLSASPMSLHLKKKNNNPTYKE